jgi:hypothetical protein
MIKCFLEWMSFGEFINYLIYYLLKFYSPYFIKKERRFYAKR